MSRLLLIEDDEVLAKELIEFLGSHGFDVRWLRSYDNIIKEISGSPLDILVLDQFVKGRDALTLLPDIRNRFEGGIVFLTGNQDTIDRIVALESGADDFILKSLGARELLARLRAVARRSRPDVKDKSASTATPASSLWSVDPRRQAVIAPNGDILQMTHTEFLVLTYLARRAGHIVTREELSQSVFNRVFTPQDRSVDNTVSRIRRAIEPHLGGDIAVRSVRGRGYIFTAFDVLQEEGAVTATPETCPSVDE